MHSIFYDTLIMIVVFLKLSYIVISIISAYAERRMNREKRKFYRRLKEESLAASEVFMYIVLMIVFFPRQRAEEIRVGKEEQLIFFILGLLGIIHTNWDNFEGFFLHVGDTITGR